MSRRNLRLVVFGGRKYNDRTTLFRHLDVVHERRRIALIIEGGATGADRGAREWAQSRGVAFVTEEAAWKDLDVPGAVIRQGPHGPYNVMAGHQRNQRMIDKWQPTGGVGFPGGTGTADMAARLRAAQLPVWEPLSSDVGA